MPRNVSTNLAAIFADNGRYIDYLLDITFPTATALRLATSPLTKSLIDYDNWIEGVGEIKQTMETPIDRVVVTLQNKNLFFQTHVSANFAEWLKAEGVLYRRYYNSDKSITEDVEVFRGAVQNFNLEDGANTFPFTLVPDTISKGLLIANRTLAEPCTFVFKDPSTCAYVGSETFCNHKLKGDCATYANTHHFGGTESRYSSRSSVPGSPGNPDTGGGSTGGPADPNGGCFLAGNHVDFTDEVSVKHETIYKSFERYKGVPVKSFDDDGNALIDFIEGVSRHRVFEYYKVKFDSDNFTTRVSSTQPYWTSNKEFLEVRQLQEGMFVIENDNGIDYEAKIESIERIEAPKGVWVYALQTKFWHHYSVNKKYVHNKIRLNENQV